MTLEERIRELEESHDELRAVLLLAGREIRKLNFGRIDSRMLQLLRTKLREARLVRGGRLSTRGEARQDAAS